MGHSKSDVEFKCILNVRGIDVVPDFIVAQYFGVDLSTIRRICSRKVSSFRSWHFFQIKRSDLDQIEFHKHKYNIPSAQKMYAFTPKGVVRLVTMLNSPEALSSIDLIIDTILNVHNQVSIGKQDVRIWEPERYVLSDRVQKNKEFIKKLNQSLDKLAATTLDPSTGTTVCEVANRLGLDALGYRCAQARRQRLRNEGLMDEARLIVEQAKRVAAHHREHDPSSCNVAVTNVEWEILRIEQLIGIHEIVSAESIISILHKFK